MIAHLDPNTEYILEVRAVNDKNMTGPPANLTVNTSIPEGKVIYVQFVYCYIIIIAQLLDFFSMIINTVTTVS